MLELHIIENFVKFSNASVHWLCLKDTEFIFDGIGCSSFIDNTTSYSFDIMARTLLVTRRRLAITDLSNRIIRAKVQFYMRKLGAHGRRWSSYIEV